MPLPRRFGRQTALLLVPFAWVAVELARARITGLPWDLLGIAQVDNPLLTRLAPITGVYGLSFIIAAVNALWLIRIRIRERRFTRPVLTIAGVVIVVLYIAGLRLIANPSPTPTTATATLVQENLEVGAANTGPQPSTQQFLDSFSYLSRYPSPRFLLGIPELPGTPSVLSHPPHAPVRSRQLQRARPNSNRPHRLARISRTFHHSTLTSTQPCRPCRFQQSTGDRRQHRLRAKSRTTNPATPLFNRASLITPDGTFDGSLRQDPSRPFGEYVPFKDFFFFASNLPDGAGDLDRGTSRTVFTFGGHTYGTFICYESIFGDEVRQFVKNGAEVLVNISDDGWYGDTSAAWQHLNMVRMRAIENHRWILRATNTGVTAAINPYGRVTAAAPRHQRTSIRVHFGYENDLTFYSRYGDLFAYACALLTTLALAFSSSASRSLP